MRRRLVAMVAIAGGSFALIWLAAAGEGGRAATPGAAARSPAPLAAARVLQEGQALFVSSCAAQIYSGGAKWKRSHQAQRFSEERVHEANRLFPRPQGLRRGSHCSARMWWRR